MTQHVSLLEQMSCIECVLTFLGLFDLISFSRCRKKIKKLCEKQIYHRRVFDMSSIPTCNLNDIWKIKITNNTVISNLKLLNNIKEIAAYGSYKVSLSLMITSTVIVLKCDEMKKLPPNLQTLRLCVPQSIPPIGFFPSSSSLTSLSFVVNGMCPGLLPDSLIYLDMIINGNENTLVENVIPKNVKTLVLYMHNTCILLKNSLPGKIKYLTLESQIDSSFAHDFAFPQHLKMLNIWKGFASFDSMLLPLTLRSLKLHQSLEKKQQMKFPPLLKKLTSEGLRDDLIPQLTQLTKLTLFDYLLSDDVICNLVNLQTLNLYTKREIGNLEPLVNLTKLNLLVEDDKKIKLPQNLKYLQINGWCQMQDMSHLSRLEKLKLECEGDVIFSHLFFPMNLRILKIRVHFILFDIFPSFLQELKLDIEEVFEHPTYFPSTLLKLSLSRIFLQFNLDEMIPPDLQTLCLPKEAMTCINIKFPNIHYRNNFYR